MASRQQSTVITDLVISSLVRKPSHSEALDERHDVTYDYGSHSMENSVTISAADLWVASTVFFGKAGQWVQDTWVSHNEAYFGSRLTPLPILFGLTPHGGCLGHYSHGKSITLHTSLLRRDSDAWQLTGLLGERYASDVLLHEMVHQRLWEIGYRGAESHECAEWCDEITRISPLIGLDCKAKLIKRKRVDGRQLRIPDAGYMTQAQISTWPHSMRPRNYYEEATADLRARHGL